MSCKACPYRQLCKDLLAEGFEDLTCVDVMRIAKAEEVEDGAVETGGATAVLRN